MRSILLSRLPATAMLALFVGGCTALLGDYSVTGDASSPDAVVDAPRANADGSIEASVDAASDADGALDGGCGPSELTCAGRCVPGDARNCGGCGHDCTSLRHVTGSASCSAAGTCILGASACAPGYANCDGNPDNGCEADLSLAAHCGSCSTTCSGGTPQCAAQGDAGRSFACGPACNPGYHLCGSTCVSDTSTGSCGTVSCTPCTAPANATAACDGTNCGYTCNTGFHDCSGVCSDDTSIATCGTSCVACPVPVNGAARCDGTSCGTTCNAGYHDCAGVCDSNRSTASCGPTSCAPCLPPAGGAATCDGLSCGFTCRGLLSACGGACVDESSDLYNCGSCGKQCVVAPGCSGGRCTVRYGYTTPFSSNTNTSSNYMFGMSVTVSVPITVTALASIGASGAVSTQGAFVMGLYTDSGGAPSSLLTYTGASTMTPGPMELPVVIPVLIDAGTYWVTASVASPGNNAWSYQTTGTSDWAGAFTYTGTMPAGAPTGISYSAGINFYLVGYE